MLSVAPSLYQPSIYSAGGSTSTAQVNTATIIPTVNMGQDVSAGTLGGTRTITISNALNWLSGSMADNGRTDVLQGAALNITGAARVDPGRVFNNFTSASITGSGSLSVSADTQHNTTTFNNQPELISPSLTMEG